MQPILPHAALRIAPAFLIALVACSSGESASPTPDASSSSSPDGSSPSDGAAGSLSDTGPSSDAPSNPTTLDDASPTSAGSCTPASGNTGNSKNVGAYCTKNGGQCSKFTGVECSIDLSAQGGNFCILIGCSADGDCGEDACCTGQPGNPIHACVPNGCFDAGVCQGIPQ